MPLSKKQLVRLIRLVAQLKENRYPNCARFSEEMRQFVDACENDKPTPVGIHAGLQSVKIGLAAKKSVAEHRPVKLSEID